MIIMSRDILTQAVSAAQRELSGCEDRSEDPDTEPGDSHEDEATRWAELSITVTAMDFLFIEVLHKFDSWPLGPEKVKLPQASSAQSSKQWKILWGRSAPQARVKVNVRKNDSTLENMPIIRIGTWTPRKWQMSWSWIIILKVAD